MSTLEPRPIEPFSLDALRHRLSGLEKLLELTRHLAANIDPDLILQRIAQDACDAIDCDRASLYQYDHEAEVLITRVATELEIAEVRAPLGHGISGSAAATGQIVNVANVAVDPRWNSSVDDRTGYRTESILAAPLRSGNDGSLLGVLELFNKRDGAFTGFDEELLLAFSQHAAAALDRLRLIEQLREQHAVETSLNVARDIQRGFMPSQLPHVTGYEMATWWFPNQAVGGDYCDVLRLPDKRLGLVIADVSGHGIGPSLLMASVRAALRALILQHSYPEALLELLGRALACDLQDGRFITMVLAAIDPQDHVLEFANAGHAPALCYHAHDASFESLESTGLPLGVLDEASYSRSKPIALAPGDLVVLCTDGIVEAMNEENELFGRPRLEGIIRAHAQSPVEEIVRAVGRAVEAHYVGESPPDDLTILAARRNA
jgi:serine phosphatase RsbU (regulator of sigma subunit)